MPILNADLRSTPRRASTAAPKQSERPKRSTCGKPIVINLDSEDDSEYEEKVAAMPILNADLRSTPRRASTAAPKQSERPKRSTCGKPIVIDLDSEDDSEYEEKLPTRRGRPKKVEQTLSPRKRGRPKKCRSSSGSEQENEPKTPQKAKSQYSDCVTPPKQRKTAGGDELFSPSRLFAELNLDGSPTKVEQPAVTPYRNARRALHSTVPEHMPGRETEHEQLRSFITGHLENGSSGTLYISGPPGTGKTASLTSIVRGLEVTAKFRQVYINCTSIKSSAAIYSKIAGELGIQAGGKDCVVAIESYLDKTHKSILLVLDEIDQLESRKQSVLYTIFEWPARKKSRLILIGIANALDLTDRILPRLQTHCELKPQLLHFSPYTKQQIVEIFTERLRAAGVLDLFSPVALQMLAGKVAAISGDVRRALDIGRRVVEIVEQNKALKENGEATTVDLRHVMGVLDSVYGTANKLDEAGDDCFPLQQKIIVCSLLLVLRQAKNKDVTVGRLHEVYRKVCGKRNLLAVDQAEFVGLCSLIETRGMIRLCGRKEPRLHKVNLEWDEEEVSATLRDKQLMSQILQDTSVLGKM